MREEVAKALEKVRPALQADGGDVELIDLSIRRRINRDPATWRCGSLKS